MGYFVQSFHGASKLMASPTAGQLRPMETHAPVLQGSRTCLSPAKEAISCHHPGGMNKASPRPIST
eukprot:scaffold4755_cov123-Isochrysis_galbana.AAC.2